ncbi:MAG: hypothetical protein C0430_00440 [Flavobacterium sp.]|nr:hypothetical protein [Flavobacterium sp.]
MKNNTKLLLSLLIMIVGWLMSGFGFTTKLGHPISTICFLLGFTLTIIGIIFFIIIIKEK